MKEFAYFGRAACPAGDSERWPTPQLPFARSDFSDIAPSFYLFLDRFFCCYRFDYPAGTGSIAMLRSIAPNRRRFRVSFPQQ
jgi:hypothetical protein